MTDAQLQAYQLNIFAEYLSILVLIAFPSMDANSYFLLVATVESFLGTPAGSSSVCGPCPEIAVFTESFRQGGENYNMARKCGACNRDLNELLVSESDGSGVW